MDKQEFLDAIEEFGQSLGEYAKIAKKDLSSVEDADLVELSDKVIKPVFLINFKRPHLQDIKRNLQSKNPDYNYAITAEAEKQGKRVLEDTLKRLKKKDEF